MKRAIRTTSVGRTYLYVPPEENTEVEGLGARWDALSMCWYIDAGEDATNFSKWLPDDAQDEEFTIASEHAYVASATTACWKCHAKIQVICVYCEIGTVLGETLSQFTVSGLWDMDGALARQLEPWPDFRMADDGSGFANHCSRCGAQQQDVSLHCEPGQPFFSIAHAAPGSMQLTPLPGRIQLSGDESFAS